MIDIAKITNPIIRRALQERERDFIFNYGDTYSAVYGDSSQSLSTHPNHSDYEKYGDYSERSGHSDEYAAGRKHGGHVDTTTKHQEYNEGYRYGDTYHDYKDHTDAAY